MIVSTIAQISEDVLGFGERLNTDPRRALAAHLRKRHRLLGTNPYRHVVATNAGQRLTALRYSGRRVMRTAGAEVRDARHFLTRSRKCCFLRLEELEPRLDDRAGVELGDACGNDASDHGRSKF